jgi:NAD(P)-dependent dehydrogenase (short-subunit alcohol dehydrogenase family)
MEFINKVAIVTGGGQGIGRACTLALARDGAAVVVADIDPEANFPLVRGINSWGGQAHAVIADVAEENGAARIATEAVATFGGIDILVNNAGVLARGTVESTPVDVWQRTLAVNLGGVYLMSRFAIPEMRRRGSGSIVNLASLHGLLTAPNTAAYAASKGGVIALTRSMALDYAAEGIRVNAVCPGAIDTAILRETARLENAAHPGEKLREWGRMQPIGRLGTPEEVAELILFLASSRASFITGSVYTIDGGLGAGY